MDTGIKGCVTLHYFIDDTCYDGPETELWIMDARPRTGHVSAR